ncbi:MAG: LytTR family DNA-binding domain-containing protein [Chitinophagaceae bacterium]
MLVNNTQSFTAGHRLSTHNLTPDQESVEALLDGTEPVPAKADYFFIIEDKKFIKIRFSEITCIEACRCYLYVYLKDQKHMVLGSMAQLEKRLPVDVFCRIHRSWIIPLEGISVIAKSKILVHEHWYPLGATYRSRLLEQMRPYVFNRNYLSEL